MSSNKPLIITSVGFLVGCIMIVIFFLFCCFFCVVIGFSFFNIVKTEYNEVSPYAQKICGIEDNELEDAYNNLFTVRYKYSTTLLEFKQFYKKNIEVFDTCESKFVQYDYMPFINEGFSFEFDYKNDYKTAELIKPVNDKYLKLGLVKVDNKWLIDEIKILDEIVTN